MWGGVLFNNKHRGHHTKSIVFKNKKWLWRACKERQLPLSIVGQNEKVKTEEEFEFQIDSRYSALTEQKYSTLLSAKQLAP